ncbi:MAG: prephenate dehydratase [Dehalococcoidia bacterium]|nr:prephenate dehydratase [Chloroflexota bacterium]|tara:strand:- start:120 stop:941 length:822 start_codon:yes stop_codon:yes gene_type:complete
MTSKIGYLGPAGSYAEQATILYNPDAEKVPYPSIPTVAKAVEKLEVSEGLVPIENSIEGSVTYTLDLLIHDSKLLISDEVILPVHHNLLTSPGTQKSDVQLVYSHPQAFAQCRKYLESQLPGIELIASLSTSAAVKRLSEEKNVAAIGNLRAAEIYNAEVIDSHIEDNSNNVTRFVLLSENDSEATGKDKTSICFTFNDDSPGLLYKVMGFAAKEGINLAKVESRPNKLELGRYFFLLDLEGHRTDQHVAATLSAINSEVSELKILGSYPQRI